MTAHETTRVTIHGREQLCCGLAEITGCPFLFKLRRLTDQLDQQWQEEEDKGKDNEGQSSLTSPIEQWQVAVTQLPSHGQVHS